MRKVYLLSFMLLICTASWAQDPQLSQFYAAPLYLNPAFAGTTDDSRAIVNHRIQWPKLDATYITSCFSLDHNFDQINSGIGLLVTRDDINSGLKSLDIGALYSYNLELNEKLNFRGGFQLSYINRSLDFSKFTFNDMYNDYGLTGASTHEEFATDNIGFADVSLGGLLYSGRSWLGVSAHHLNRPSQSFMKGESRLPIKASFHGGYKFYLGKYDGKRGKKIEKETEKSITPCFQYKFQGEFDQTDIGLYSNYNFMVFGVWYRGLPIKPYKKGMSNNESIVMLTGFRFKGLNFGYSYDWTISGLANTTGGTHEVSLAYDFASGKQGKKKLAGRIRKLPCPQF